MEKGGVLSGTAISDPNVRKLYRACVECVKTLDQAMKGHDDLQSISNLSPIRKRLRDCCERLMFINPLEFGRKADEILWRKCYYEPIKIMRQNNESLSNETKCYLNTLLTSAIGYYQLLSMKLQQAYPSARMVYTDFPMSTTTPTLKKENDTKRTENEAENLREWCIGERHRLLVYQGDIARYLRDVDETVDVRMAQHYYHQALCLKPSNGTPYNQLGTLFLTANHGLDATYYYLRCVCSEESFGAAEDNLLTLFSKIEEQAEHLLTRQDEDQESNTKGADDDVKRFILVFLTTTRVLYQDKAESNKDGSVQAACSRTLHAFCTAVEHFVTIDTTDTGFLNFETILKTFVIQMLLIGKLHEKGSMKLSPALALFLSMFANFLTHIINDFADDLTKHRAGSLSGTGETGDGKETHGGEKANGKSKSAMGIKKPLLTRRRGRRVDEDGSCEEDETDENDGSWMESECETNAGDDWRGSGGSSSEDVVELSDEEEPSVGNGQKDDKLKDGSHLMDAASKNEIMKPLIDLDPCEKMEILATYTALVPLKVVCDWFRCHPDFLLLVQQNSRELWSLLGRFLNFLPDDKQLSSVVEENSRLSTEWKDAPILYLNDWAQKYPLPEDVMLRGVKQLSQIHAGLDFSRHFNRSSETEAIVRICCLRGFGHFLIRLNTPCFQFDRARLEFIVSNGRTIIQDVKERDKKEALMRSMAQLRLKDELATAEQLAWIPVYLVLDALSLCNKLPMVKKLASAQKFIFVIPTVSINQLDAMKKENVRARSATRWLEEQFSRGNKFVRMQKTTERDTNLVISDDDAAGETDTKFVEILKCASQLRKLVKAGTTCSSTIVTILTGYSTNSTEYQRVEKMLQNTGLSGVSLSQISVFCEMWDSHRKRGS